MVCFKTQLKKYGLAEFFKYLRKLFGMSDHDNIDDLKKCIDEYTLLLEYDTEERLIGVGIPKESILYVSKKLRKMFRRNRKIDRKITETSIYVYKPFLRLIKRVHTHIILLYEFVCY